MSDEITILIIIALFVISILVARNNEDWLNPLIVFITPVTLQYCIYYFFISDKLTPTTNKLFATSSIIFFIGFFYYKLTSRSSLSQIKYVQSEIPLHLESRMFMIGITGFGLEAIKAYQLGFAPGGDVFYNLRSRANEVEETGIGGYLILILHIIILYKIYNINPQKQDTKLTKQAIFGVILLLIASVFTVARTALSLYLFSIMGLLYYKRRGEKNKSPAKLFVFFFLIFMIFSYLFASLTNKVESDAGGFFLTAYLGSPIVAFDRWILNIPHHTYGTNTFAFIFKLLSLIGFSTKIESIDTIYFASLSEFNVYTFMSKPYIDFGEYGLYICLFLCGFVYSYFSSEMNKFIKPTWISVLTYSIFLQPLMLSFYEWQCTSSMMLYYLLVVKIINKYFTSTAPQHQRCKQ